MTHPLRVAENCTTHPLHKAQNLMTHPLSAPAYRPPPPLPLYFLTSPSTKTVIVIVFIKINLVSLWKYVPSAGQDSEIVHSTTFLNTSGALRKTLNLNGWFGRQKLLLHTVV